MCVKLSVAFLIVLTMAINVWPAGAVVGGSAIPIESAPWAVALLLKSRAVERVRCSGVIIDPLHIVTAAHCLYNGNSRVRPNQLVVRTGVANVLAPERGDSLQRSVLSFRVHPDQQGGADVAVLRLARSLRLDGRHAEAIPLDKSATWRSGERATLSAFGREDPNLLPTGALRQIGLAVNPQGRCGNEILSFYQAALLLCASSDVGAACHGDSGGGLVSSGARPTLIGIEVAEEGRPCSAGQPNGYVYIGAPEIWRFIEGDSKPPFAPRSFALNLWAVPPHVGDEVLCEGIGAGKARTHYTLAVGGRVVRIEKHGFSYTIRAADVGKRLTCRGSATNAGGTSAQWWRSSAIKP